MRSALYRRWPATLGTIAIVALVCVVPIAVTAGARRTSTAADRYTAAFGSSVDGVVTQEDGGPPRTREVASLPGVLSTEAYTFVFGGLTKAGASDLAGALVFAGSYAPGYHLISGRDAQRSSPEEFVASQSFVDRVGAAIGDRFGLVTLIDHARVGLVTVPVLGMD